MAIAAPNSSPTMSLSHSHSHEDGGTTTAASTTNDNLNGNGKQEDDDHEHDMVMPGFRFHPTEEELVEFYLRRKVEGKRFNVELITFLDLYRYDPWELPALAAIGEKEWYFYVPRDRKYRNGDRPNRVTTSGYWKATGADRMIRTENFRSIGLKKTLVFYSGKAPKGIRTSWIMNEYRLPQHETERYQKAEISLCRVYKRAGVEDHPSLPRCLPTRAPSSRTVDHQKNKQQHHNDQLNMGFAGNTADGASDNRDHDVTTALALSKHNTNAYRAPSLGLPPLLLPLDDEAAFVLMQQQQHHAGPSSGTTTMMDDLNRLVSYQHQYYNSSSSSSNNNNPNHHHHLLMHQQQQQQQQTPPAIMSLNNTPSPLATAFSDRLWEWNPLPEANQRQYSNMSFK
ncbi:hypothetical protein HN51_002910 [Arachis hypogaea]|uniref:NAC domain-containing protein 68 n=1 Tax=Arachis hypogaea TaxID=3818 RepID=UPI000DEC654C|nr:NAC domain-containing protein 35 [Arachis hypogaea]QHO51186.1 Putative NAC domain-containing protein [Arachis hypogaea]